MNDSMNDAANHLVTMREAVEADLPAILALYAQPAMNDGESITQEAAQQIFGEMKRYPSYRLFVAQAEGVIVGTYALLIMHNLAHGGTPAAVVESVVVDERLRSRGIGKAMMDHAWQLASEAGCYKLALSSNRRRTRAHAFYESLGFERHGFSFVIEH